MYKIAPSRLLLQRKFRLDRCGNRGLGSETEGPPMPKVDSSLVAHLPLFAGFSAGDLDSILSEA
jgi:hypothetical protein